MQKISNNKTVKQHSKRKIRWDRILIILALLNGLIAIVAIGANHMRVEREEKAKCLFETWYREPVETVVRRKLTYLGEFKLTGYCPCELCCGPYASGITATGTVATEGRTIAVDPNVIPLGSKIIIDGFDTEFIAEDTGSAINENKIDIFVNNHEDAYKAIYNRTASVYLVEVENNE